MDTLARSGAPLPGVRQEARHRAYLREGSENDH